MEILRIPWLYQSQIEYLSESDSEYVLKNIFRLARWKDIKLEHSMRGWLVLSIWREAVQMENKARAKKWEKRLEIDDATLMGDTVETVKVENVRPSNIKSSQVTSSKIKESNIVVSSEITETKVSTNNLQELIKDTFDSSFIENLNDKYKLSKEDFNEQCGLFYNHWSETSPNWKKQRWQKEKTFDPKLRFYKWLSNNKKWTKPTKYEDHENIESILW